MKYGVRKPSVKKSISARTTGKMKRTVKKAVNPMYGKNGSGVVRNPKKSMYNKVYSKTSVGLSDLYSSSEDTDFHSNDIDFSFEDFSSIVPTHSSKYYKVCGNVSIFFSIIALLLGILILLIDLFAIVIILIGLFLLWLGIYCKRTARDIDNGKYDNSISDDDSM